jgi:hypothetical protein
MKQCAPRDLHRVPKPKYEATALQARLTILVGNAKRKSAYLNRDTICFTICFCIRT